MTLKTRMAKSERLSKQKREEQAAAMLERIERVYDQHTKALVDELEKSHPDILERVMSMCRSYSLPEGVSSWTTSERRLFFALLWPMAHTGRLAQVLRNSRKH